MFEDYENIMAKEKWEREDMEQMILNICNPYKILKNAVKDDPSEE
mgnify:CR=1 FL=1